MIVKVTEEFTDTGIYYNIRVCLEFRIHYPFKSFFCLSWKKIAQKISRKSCTYRKSHKVIHAKFPGMFYERKVFCVKDTLVILWEISK